MLRHYQPIMRLPKAKKFFCQLKTDKRCLVGYLRLRIPSAKHIDQKSRLSLLPSCGNSTFMAPCAGGKTLCSSMQHRGYGSILLREAERVSHEDYDLKKILVISALGTKQYYMQHGYERDGVYMSKKMED